MTEETTTKVRGFWLNEDEENQPVKLLGEDEEYYSTFKEEEVFDDYAPEQGDEVVIEWFENDKGYRTIESIEPTNTSPDQEEDSGSSGRVSSVDRQTSIEAQGLLKEARETELSLSARREDYEFTEQGVKQRAVEYAGILKDLKKEIARQ